MVHLSSFSLVSISYLHDCSPNFSQSNLHYWWLNQICWLNHPSSRLNQQFCSDYQDSRAWVVYNLVAVQEGDSSVSKNGAHILPYNWWFIYFEKLFPNFEFKCSWCSIGLVAIFWPCDENCGCMVPTMTECLRRTRIWSHDKEKSHERLLSPPLRLWTGGINNPNWGDKIEKKHQNVGRFGSEWLTGWCLVGSPSFALKKSPFRRVDVSGAQQ